MDDTGLTYALADSAGAWCIPDLLGVFELGVLRPPEGPPVKLFGRHNILKEGLEIALNADTGGLPAASIGIGYDRNWLVQARKDMAENATETDIAYAGQRDRVLQLPAASVAALHPLAKPLLISTLLRTRADAQRRADRAFAFYCADRMTVTVPIASSEAAGVQRGQVIGLQDRFDWGSSAEGTWKPFLVLGEIHERRSGKSFLIVVG